ncbi:FHA domain-containing protein [Arthrobacter oryzae]|uniref:FHA domain-containing protein n=1 Tax=Arthrobacter oryzae TaxID=409290 RepID=UPI00273C050C|nr:FHA domain-containing protein [Arthrobacter oryzae]WLQ07110.1 FHA domain-containing protein [Arthrobacter oryzae]
MTDGSVDDLVCPVCRELWPPDYWQCPNDAANLVHPDSESNIEGGPGAVAASPQPLQPSANAWQLSVQGGGTLLVPAGETVVLGRSADLASSPLFAPFDAVSRFHCTVSALADRLQVCDADSTNGTFVNNERLAPNALHDVGPDDVLRLGSKVVISVLLIADDDARRQPAKEGST